MEDSDTTLDALRALQALGVQVAMDDFGTGYSSLGYLQKFPFDKIKIDSSFVSGLPDDSESFAVARAVAALATSFGMISTAEGVETQGQLEAIRDLGFTEMQGYLFSKPCPILKLKGVLNNQLPPLDLGIGSN